MWNLALRAQDLLAITPGASADGDTRYLKRTFATFTSEILNPQFSALRVYPEATLRAWQFDWAAFLDFCKP